MQDRPFSHTIQFPCIRPDRCDHHIKRTLASLRGQFADAQAFEQQLLQEDVLLYEVFEFSRPEQGGELNSGLSIVHPGKVGDEYFMTKGHYHTVRETAEIYYGLAGEGVMVMETAEGDWCVEALRPGVVLYVPPNWAHRSVNTALTDDLVTFFVYPANAGHDYGTIETLGFRKLVVDRGRGPEVVDNPRWRPPRER